LYGWLNGEFYTRAFRGLTDEQKRAIEDRGDGKVFCLSVEEAKDAFGANEPGSLGYYEKLVDGCKYTPFALGRGTDYAKIKRDGCELWYRENKTAPKYQYRSNTNTGSEHSDFKDTKVFDRCNGSSCWWLRSPGSSVGAAADVDDGGYVGADGGHVDNCNVGVRPALWINL
jgi:hypothetical protein